MLFRFEICRDPDRYITRTVAPDLKRLGPKLGKLLPQARQALEKGDAAALLAALDRDGRIELALPGGTALIEREDVLVRTTAREGWAAAEGPRAVVVIAAELTPELVAEGLAREVIHAVQTARKNRVTKSSSWLANWCESKKARSPTSTAASKRSTTKRAKSAYPSRSLVVPRRLSSNSVKSRRLKRFLSNAFRLGVRCV